MDHKMSCPKLHLSSMNDTIFQNRLHSKLWNPAFIYIISVRRIAFDRKLKSVSKSVFLNIEICSAVLKFLFNRYQIFNFAYRISEESRKCFRHISDICKPAYKRLTPYALERVIQKMRIDLILQRKILRLSLTE